MIRINRTDALMLFSIFCMFASGVWFLIATSPEAEPLSWLYLAFFLSQSALFSFGAKQSDRQVKKQTPSIRRAGVYSEVPLPRHRGEYVYLAQDIDATHYVKIGHTNDLRRRLGEFGVTLPFRVRCIHYFRCKNRYAVEAMLHRRYGHKRVSGEWFCLSDADIKELMKTSVM